MPDIKLRDGSGVENTYEEVDTITLPLADGSGTWTFGLTDEDCNFTGAQINWLSIPLGILKQAKGRIYFGPCTNSFGWSGSYEGVTQQLCDVLDGAVLELESNTSNAFCSAGLFRGWNLKNLPNVRIIGNNGTATSGYGNFNLYSWFQDCKNLRSIPNLLSELTDYNGISWNECVSGSLNSLFQGCYSLREVPNWLYQLNRQNNNQSYLPYYYLFYNCYSLNKIENLPVFIWTRGPLTNSSSFSQMVYGCMHLKNFTFETNNGVPIVVQWKGQTIDLSTGVGYYDGSFDSVFTSYNSGLTKNDNVLLNITTIEDATNRYNQLKETDDWYSSSSSYVLYDGTKRYLSLLFSRYNHDSAVNTINSLPDTSAYLATAGGTNTIKFRNYSGALTDGGGINDLTAAEIQVATDKGWTVTIVN